MTTPTPSTSLRAPEVGRRALLRTAAWSVPAITIASAAFANSRCEVITAFQINWSQTNVDTSKGDTGWYAKGKGGTGTYISANEEQYFNGAREGNGSDTLEPDGSFISFGNNNTTNQTATVTVTYGFEVTGDATVELLGRLGLGYGNSGTDPQQTERQTVTVAIVDSNKTPVIAAKAAHQRRGTAANPDASTYLPTGPRWGANATTYGQLSPPDTALRTSGFTLHRATPTGGHATRVDYRSNVVHLTGTRTRTVQVVFTLTLPRRVTTAWVNDDVVIQPPTIRMNCT